MAIYYFLIALMRFYLVRHTRNYKPGEELDGEYNFYYDDIEDLNSIEIDVSNFVHDVY